MSATAKVKAKMTKVSTKNIKHDNRTTQPSKKPEQAPGKYRVTVITEKCIGAASCVAIAPKVFGLNEKQIAYVISEDELDDIKLLAAQSCPTAAIVVTDIETGEQVWPK